LNFHQIYRLWKDHEDNIFIFWTNKIFLLVVASMITVNYVSGHTDILDFPLMMDIPAGILGDGLYNLVKIFVIIGRDFCNIQSKQLDIPVQALEGNINTG
jgi:hypothetical protein